MANGWEDEEEPFRVVPKDVADKIKESLEGYYPGRWAEEASRGPACKCGLKPESIKNNAGFTRFGRADTVCPRHGVEI